MGGLADAFKQTRRAAASGGRRPPPQKTATELAAESQLAGKAFGEAVGTEGRDELRAQVVSDGERIIATMKAAGRTSGPEWERASKMIAYGYDPQVTEAPFLAKAADSLSWLDKLGATVRFGIADVFQFDKRAGAEFGAADLGDIWGGNWESILQRHGEQAVGDDGRFGGGQFLDIGVDLGVVDLKWETEKGESAWYNRLGHGVLGFGIELLTDPLSLVGGGLLGVGKKAALSATRKLTDDAMRLVGTAIRTGSDDVLTHTFERGLYTAARKKVDDAVVTATEKAGEKLSDDVVEDIVKKSLQEVRTDSLITNGQKIANRDFGTLADDFVDYAKANKQGYLGGGLQIRRSPFSTKGLRVTGTAGTGRRITRGIFGTPLGSEAPVGLRNLGIKGISKVDEFGASGLRGWLDKKPGINLTQNWRNLQDVLGTEHSMIRAFMEGDRAAVGLLDISSAAKAASRRLGIAAAGADIGRASDKLWKSVRKSGMNAAEQEQYYTDLLSTAQGGRLFNPEVGQSAGKEVAEAAEEFVATWHRTFDAMHDIAKSVDMDLGKIDRYIPLVHGENLYDVFQRMHEKRVAINITADMPEEQQAALALLDHLYTSWQRRVALGRKAVGDSEFATNRAFGKTVKVRDMDGTTIVELMEDGPIDFINHVDLNRSVTAAIQAVAEANQVFLPKGFQALEQNPFAIAERYFKSMTRAIDETVLIHQARSAGLIRRGTFAIDKNKVAANMFERLRLATPRQKQMVTDTIEAADERAAYLADIFDKEGIVPPLTTRKPKKVNLGHGSSIEVDPVLLEKPKVKQAISQQVRKNEAKYVHHQALVSERDQLVVALRKQHPDAPEEFLTVVADARVLGGPLDDIRRALEGAALEQANLEAMAAAEVAARKVVPATKELEREARAALRGVRAAKKAQKNARKNAYQAAVAKVRKRSGTKPVRVTAVNTPDAERLLANELRTSVASRVEELAVQADNIPGGEKVAEKLREVASYLSEETLDEASQQGFSNSMRDARRFLDALNGEDVASRLTVTEWFESLPKLKKRMAYTQQEKVMAEWDKLPTVDTPPLRSRVGKDDQTITADREAWFAEFNEMHGIDLRQIGSQDRKRLQVLLDPNGSPTAQAKYLTVPDGVPADQPMKRSMQAMLIDVSEQAKAAGKGKRKPDWQKINHADARAMSPDEFQKNYGPMFVAAAQTDPDLESIIRAHGILFDGANVGRNIDTELSGLLATDFETLAALGHGANVWRNPRQREALERMFADSAMSAEYHLAGAPGGKFQIQSIEEITMLPTTKLRKQLDILGHTGTFEEAATLVRAGKLKSLSREAKDTLLNTPTADMRDLDEFITVAREGISSVVAAAPTRTAKEVKRAIEAEKTLKQLTDLLPKRGADGMIPPGTLRQLEDILFDTERMKNLKRVLGPNDHPKLDNMVEQVRTVRALRDVGDDQITKEVIRKNRKLQQELMFDSDIADRALLAAKQELDLARSGDEFVDAAAQLDAQEEVLDFLLEVAGLATDPETGLVRAIYASEDEVARLGVIGKEGEKLAKRLGWDNVAAAFRDLPASGVVPTAELPGYVPATMFGLTGSGIEGMVIEGNFGKFMEHTMKNMMAMQTPAGLQAYGTMMRQTMHWWKGMATVARSTFHVRNFMSAGWANMTIDVGYRDYAFVTRHYKSLNDAYKKTGDWVQAAESLSNKHARFYFREAALSGIFEQTFASSELLGRAARRGQLTNFQKLNPVGRHGILLNMGGKAMETVEGYHRLAAFVRHMDDRLIDSVDDAALEGARTAANDLVNMVHFDYNNLTAVEEGFKKYIPFFVWTRRNLPLQMRTLVERPGVLARYNHAVWAANDELQSKDDIGPRRFGGQHFIGTDIVMNEDTPFWARLILDPDIPIKDLFAIEDPLSPKSYVNLMTNLLGPQLKEPLKLAFQDEYQDTAPVGLQSVTRAWNNLWNGEATDYGQTRPTMNNLLAAFAKTMFPPASEYLTAFEDDPRRMQRLGIVDEDLSSRIRAGLGDLVLPGLGVKTVTPHDEAMVYSSSRSNNILSDLKKQGVLTPEIADAMEEWVRLDRRGQAPPLESFIDGLTNR